MNFHNDRINMLYGSRLRIAVTEFCQFTATPLLLGRMASDPTYKLAINYHMNGVTSNVKICSDNETAVTWWYWVTKCKHQHWRGLVSEYIALGSAGLTLCSGAFGTEMHLTHSISKLRQKFDHIIFRQNWQAVFEFSSNSVTHFVLGSCCLKSWKIFSRWWYSTRGDRNMLGGISVFTKSKALTKRWTGRFMMAWMG